MAVIDGTKSTTAAVPYLGSGRAFVLEQTVDFDALNVASGDVVEAIKVKDGMRILLVESEVVTASDAATSATIDIGDGVTTNGFDDNVDIKAAAGTIACTAIGTDAYGASGKRYTTNDTIDVIPTYTGSTTVKGKIKLRAIGFMVE